MCECVTTSHAYTAVILLVLNFEESKAIQLHTFFLHLIEYQRMTLLHNPDAVFLDNVILCDEEEQSSPQPSLQSAKEQFERYREENEIKIRDLEQTLALLGKHTDSKEEDEHNYSDSVDVSLSEDMYSLMMLKPFWSIAYFLGILTFCVQIALLILVLLAQFTRDLGGGDQDRQFKVPFGVSPIVRVGQFLVVILSIVLQSDVQIAIQYIFILQRGNSNIQQIQNHQTTAEKDGNSGASFPFMLRAVYFPNLLRFVQGLLVLAILMILIIQNDNYLDLVLDFTAIYIVSEIDDLLFKVVRRGFFCFGLTKSAADVETIVLKDEKKKNQCSIYSSSTLRSLVLVIITAAMLTILQRFSKLQNDGFFLRQVYPDCIVDHPSYIGDGICDNKWGNYNTKECGWDAGDCQILNERLGNGANIGCVVNVPAWLGDGIVSNGLTDIAHSIISHRLSPFYFYDQCDDFPPYNTEACDWDGGDCIV